jgi:D-arabinose 1-dehydrogenase-like Zn-dependent alcohol dehydrogenase
MARKLGAIHYVDNQSHDAAEELAKMGGAKVILGTVPSAKAMNAVLAGLSPNGKLMIIGASDETLQVPINQFLSGRQSVLGWYSGSSIDSQDTLAFSALSAVRDKMMNGKVRFRSILTTGKS